MKKLLLILPFLCLAPGVALASGGTLNGSDLSLAWGIPFAGLLLSLALMPVLAGRLWHDYYGHISLGWVLCLVVPMFLSFGLGQTLDELSIAVLDHYIPFVIMIGALFTIAGGIRIEISSRGTPGVNTFLLLLGTALAGWIGTTGASMLLIRPLLQVNKGRENITHIIIFFIFLVSNIGGSATPLGDPPLFLGFLNGIDFFWTLEKLVPETIMIAAPLLAIFYGIDCWMVSKEPPQDKQPSGKVRLQISGLFNFFCLFGVISFVLLSGIWKPGFSIHIFAAELALQDIVRDVALVGLTVWSWKKTNPKIHKANEFNWEPLLEVGKLFFAIFVTVVPVITMLGAGEEGPLGFLVGLVTDNGQPVNAMYFWLTGILSSFLDNAPTYIVFYYLAGGDAEVLMTTLSRTLEAISLGAVFMGAMTYIGNAPNFMVKAIAEQNGIQMPSFFGYMKWSISILIPLFLILTWVEFL